MTISSAFSTDLDAIYAWLNENKVALGLKTAQRDFKGFINESDCPFALVFVDPGQFTMQTFTTRRYNQIYRIELHCKPVSQGLSGFREGYETTLDVLCRLGSALLADLTLGNRILQIIPPINHDGVLELTWNGAKSWGSRLYLPVTEKFQ